MHDRQMKFQNLKCKQDLTPLGQINKKLTYRANVSSKNNGIYLKYVTTIRTKQQTCEYYYNIIT